MANVRTNQQSFGGGELTPEFMGRINDAKYQTGLSTCRNFTVLPHGAVQNRAGFAYVRQTKLGQARLLPFSFSNTQTFVIEMGAGYFRFHTQGATVLSGGVPYEITNPYAASDLFDIHYVQSADVVTLVHPNYPPMELRRYGNTNWQLTTINFAPTLAAPVMSTCTATQAASPSNLRTYSYLVTAVGSGVLEESLQSNALSCTNNLLQTGATNTMTWQAVTGAIRYNVYCQSNGLYGYIGQTDGLTFTDNNIAPDISKTPPISNNPFSGAGNYPAAVSYFEQRRVFAGTTNKPQNIWLTRSGTESNLNYSIPSRSDDSIGFKIAAREANGINHLVPLSSLVALSGAAEWRVTSNNSDALTPSSISVRPQSYIGSNNVQPAIINNSLVYAAARGGHVREISYNWQANGYLSSDLSLRAPHLFDNLSITDMCYQKSPYPIVWHVSSSGNLLGLTYIPDQQIVAWHHHDTTNGAFESVVTVTEDNFDVVYAVIRRVINGQTVRYVERMDSRNFTDVSDAFFVDAGVTYNTGTPVQTISGLTWLEGQTVKVLADGSTHPDCVVTNGTIVLNQHYTKVQIGLPIVADIQTVPIAFATMADGTGRVKNVNKVWLRVYRAASVYAGYDFNNLTQLAPTYTSYGQASQLITDEVQIVLSPYWGDSGQVCVRNIDPLPITILSMSMEVTVGT